MLMIDATKWNEFYQEMTKDLKPYDHYDDGYRDAMDNVDDWMDGNQVEAEPVRHGRWDYYSTTMQECSVCKRHTPRHRYTFCPHCGARMDGDKDA